MVASLRASNTHPNSLSRCCLLVFMTSTGVKKWNSQFFATVLIQDEGEPEQDVADEGRSYAYPPIMSAPQSDDTSPAIMGLL